MSIETNTKSDMLEVINSGIGAGGKVKLYTGTAPGSVNVLASGTLLASCVCNASGFGIVTGSVLAAANVAGQSYVARDDSADNDGAVGYARISSSGDVDILQFSTVGLTGSGQEVILTNLSIVAGQPVEVNAININAGN